MIVTNAVRSKRLLALLQRAGELAILREGLNPERIEASLKFVSEGKIQALNKQYRGVDAVTDVLSFPFYERRDVIDFVTNAVWNSPTGAAGYRALLGDIVICTEAAERQADEIGQSLDRELAYLFIHGMFHLLGYSHKSAEDKAKMREAEEEVLSGLGEIK